MKINRKRQGGFIVTIELLVLATVLVLGLIVGWTSLRDSVLAELSDLSESVGALSQAYSIDGVSNAASTASTNGSNWQDGQDSVAGAGSIDMQQLSGNSSTEYSFTDVSGVTNGQENVTNTI